MLQTEILYANSVIGDTPQILQDIHIQSKNIAIYQRDIKVLNQELDLIAHQSIECRASGTIEEVEATLEDYFNNKLPEYTALFNDVFGLLSLFKKTTQATTFRLMLATIQTNMCRRFHTDINDLRLLCTYIGQGTLWLPDEAINQRAIAKGSNEEIVADEALIQQVNAGDVVLLKGALYENASPILHRSPNIEKNGEKRLLLRIDTNDFLDFLS